MFKIDLLPAARGDALWIEYGEPTAPHRVLIDGGISSTQEHLRTRIEALPVDARRFDLLMISHIDLDHIAGILGLIADPPEGLKFDNVLFNGWHQLLTAEGVEEDIGLLGPKLGERVSARIEERNYPWNDGFEDKLVAIRTSTGALPTVTLTGGMRITLLSPTLDRLRKLRPVWEDEIREAGLEPGNAGASLEGIGHPEDVADEGILGTTDINVDELANGPFKDDRSVANGSSIAVLAEYDNKRCAFLGDAYASDVAASIQRIADIEGSEETVEVNATKLAHHGGRKNTSAELLQKLRCLNYLISTDGSSYDHPDPESIARVLVHGASAGRPSVIFNYRSDETDVWDNEALFKGPHPYEPIYPGDDPGVSLSL